MIFLSKGGADEYINAIARSQRTPAISDKDFTYCSKGPIFLRGLLKYKIMNKCLADGIDYYFVDTGYFGNHARPGNPNGWKLWHRIVKNNLTQTEILDTNPKRWNNMKLDIKPFHKKGRNIIIAAPDEKPCKVYGEDYSTWANKTKTKLEQYTDRPIIIRERVKQRSERIVQAPLTQLLEDAYALVTFNSNSSVEAVLNGVPVFTLAPNAADPVALKDLSKIETPFFPEDDLVRKWVYSLANGQFTKSEMINGYAFKKVVT
jgi:hypothetical protein|tara:strand:+ start:85 stop:867 length:783 start_codon:yes stop_codon:yes gene_type:complete